MKKSSRIIRRMGISLAAIDAVKPHRTNAASEIPIRRMILLLFFMVPPVFPTEGVPQGAYFVREWGALLGR